MSRPFQTDNSANTYGQPRDKDGKKISLNNGHTLIVGGDMALWDDTSSAFLNENDPSVSRSY